MEIFILRTDTGLIRAWIRKGCLIVGEQHLPYFYTSFVAHGIMEHVQMMDDYGNLFPADCYQLLRD